ncbi:MAG: iron ABC transporter permease [Eubacterium sp.]
MNKKHLSLLKKTPENRSLGVVLAITGILLVMLMFTALCVGRYAIPLGDVVKILLSKIFTLPMTWDKTMYDVVINLRVPRILAAVLVGSGLALAGATYQGIFKNPLVSPDLLGVSSGACVGTALAILLGMGTVMIQIFAFIGGLLTVILTTAIPRLMHRNSTLMLVLAGVIVGGFMNSIIGLTKYVADTETQLPDMTYWQLGSIAKITYPTLVAIAPIMIISGTILLIMRWRINLLSLGDYEAQSLGVNLRFERGIAIICSTVLTASAVCMSGTIGWIGLVMPHLGRMLVGNDNTRLLPVTIFISAGFLIIIDTLARTLTGGELPLGILTGFIGAPFFTWVLIKQRVNT